MNMFWVMNGQKLKKYLIIMVAALFTAGILYVERDALTVFSSDYDSLEALSNETDPQVISGVDTDEKKLALTFDISWGHEKIEPILDTLQQNDLEEATFFLSSPWAENYPEIVEQIQEAGYEIGSHGHKHENYTHYTDEEIREQLEKSRRILRSITGEVPELIRPPNGDVDERVLAIADELNYTVIGWETDSQDWLNPGVERIVENVISNAHPGDIILMHASDSSKQTAEALPEIIRQLKQQGYEFVSVTDLITGAEGNVDEMD